jgi:hypothetical protein
LFGGDFNKGESRIQGKEEKKIKIVNNFEYNKYLGKIK